MISNLRNVLTEIRKAREAELEKYRIFCGDNKFLFEVRRSILLLELPYKTDTVSILYARAKAYESLEEERENLIRKSSGITVSEGLEEVQNDMGEGCHRVKREIQKKVNKSSTNAHSFILQWIKSDEKKVHSRRVLYSLLKRGIIQFTQPSSVSAEDIPHILTMKAMTQVIENQDMDDSSKEVYLSHAKSLRKYVCKVLPISPVLIGRRAVLSLDDAAKLFEYLETRALRSSTSQKYHDLLLCRALFYAPLPTREFFNLRDPESTQLDLKSNGEAFHVPNTFIQLKQALDYAGPLFLQIFDDRGFHKKINRLGQYAGLAIESLTPSIMRQSAKAAYTHYLSIDENVMRFLPRR